MINDQNTQNSTLPTPVPKARRGFAAMDPDRQRQIARQGGRAAHAHGTAHQFNSTEAREAGRKGGQIISRDRQHMAAIGAEGGRASGINRAASRAKALLAQAQDQFKKDQLKEDQFLISKMDEEGAAQKH